MRKVKAQRTMVERKGFHVDRRETDQGEGLTQHTPLPSHHVPSLLLWPVTGSTLPVARSAGGLRHSRPRLGSPSHFSSQQPATNASASASGPAPTALPSSLAPPPSCPAQLTGAHAPAAASGPLPAAPGPPAVGAAVPPPSEAPPHGPRGGWLDKPLPLPVDVWSYDNAFGNLVCAFQAFLDNGITARLELRLARAERRAQDDS